MEKPLTIMATDVPPTTTPSLYPEPLASMMKSRTKRRLGEAFGLSNFGVNLTTLAPGGSSALRHAHTRQDEFIYIISGTPALHTDAGIERLAPGMCAGFAAATSDAHRLYNDTDADVTYLEVGDRSAGDQVSYPDDDLMAIEVDGSWRFLHKDGTPY